MKIVIKDFSVSMELGNSGITFEVRNPDGTHRGDLRLGRAKIEWCKGRTREGNGIKVGWNEFIDWMESEEES